MGKNKTWVLVFCFVCYFNSGAGQSVLEDYPVIPQVTEQRKKLIEIAISQAGIREATGNNDGKEIWKYQKAAGIPKNSFWCAAFVVWCHLQLNSDLPIPISGWSPDLFKSNLVYRKTESRMSPWMPRGGEIFGKYYESKGRVAHVGIIEEKWGKHYHTIEGNTSLSASFGMNISDENDRDGIWVARKIRQASDIYVVSDYVGYEELKAATTKTRNKYFKLK
jgi:hypothetical protein